MVCQTVVRRWVWDIPIPDKLDTSMDGSSFAGNTLLSPRDPHSAVESITRTTGQRPLGWYTRYGPSVNIRDLVVEEGGFVYDCNAYNDDLPYYTDVKGRKWLVVPYSLEVNDYGFWRGQLSTPNDFFESARNSFDTLYREGATHPKMMSVGLHCRIIGKPSRSAALRQFLEYVKKRPGVWFARRIDIARWWLDKYPG